MAWKTIDGEYEMDQKKKNKLEEIQKTTDQYTWSSYQGTQEKLQQRIWSCQYIWEESTFQYEK